MSEMVERVARAIAEEFRPRVVHPEEAQQIARAAIEAMREPTEGMVAVRYLADFGERGAQLSAEDHAGIWQEMIDEALK